MKQFIKVVTLGTALTTGGLSSAWADDYEAWYVGLSADVSSTSDSDVSGSATGSVEYDASLSLPNIVVGYRPEALYSESGAIRFEGELLGRGFDVDSTTSGGVTNNNPDNQMAFGALMANVYYDVHTDTSFTPFIGGGVGVGIMGFDKNPGFGITDKTSDDGVFTYQFKTGVAYTPQIWPSTDFTLGYTYVGSDDPEFKTGASTKAKLDGISASSVQLGISYHF